MLYDGSTFAQLTDNDLPDHRPYVSGSQVVWWQQDGNDGEIMLHDGNTIVQLTDNDYRDYRPRVSGTNVAWLGDPDNSRENDVFFFDGSTITQLTHGDCDADSARVNGNGVVWKDLPDVYLYDGTTTVNLTPGDSRGSRPDIWGSRVAWTGHNGDGSYGVFLYDGQSTVRLTEEDNDWGWGMPDVSDRYVVWRARELGGDTYRIFVFDGDSTIQLTETDAIVDDLDASGMTIVWREYRFSDGTDSEIFMATIPEPSARALAVLGTLVLLPSLLLRPQRRFGEGSPRRE
jgi:hypothetical protein